MLLLLLSPPRPVKVAGRRMSASKPRPHPQQANKCASLSDCDAGVSDDAAGSMLRPRLLPRPMKSTSPHPRAARTTIRARQRRPLRTSTTSTTALRRTASARSTSLTQPSRPATSSRRARRRMLWCTDGSPSRRPSHSTFRLVRGHAIGNCQRAIAMACLCIPCVLVFCMLKSCLV